MATYTDEQRTEAVRLYLDEGVEAACQTVGCHRVTLYRWIGKHATDVANEKDERRRQTLVDAHAAKREALRMAMLDAALAGAIAADPDDAKSYQLLSVGSGTFLDKYRLEMGEHTERRQHSVAVIPTDPDRLNMVLDVLGDIGALPSTH